MNQDFLTELERMVEERWPLGPDRTYDQQTRELLEHILMWMSETKTGRSFMEWLDRRTRSEGGT